MSRKIIYLFLALALPGLIFIFLKRFGKNEFDIPVLYTHTADSLNSVCGTRYTSPYRVSDTLLQRMEWKKKKATIFLFNRQVAGKELNRVSDIFASSEFEIIAVRDKGKTAAADYSGVAFVTNDTASYRQLQRCVFFMKPLKDLVLMDDQRRIRGYYLSTGRDEIDRLIVELKILLKQY